MFLALVTLLFLLNRSWGAIDSDLVTELPGWNGSLPSKQYSGLLELPNNDGVPRYYHYWLVQSENEPQKDPFVVWYNGGPGASSLLGYFVEHGPFHTNDYSVELNTTDIPVLFYNNYTWTKVANILYLEMPGGVGFSFCGDPDDPVVNQDPGLLCPHWNDSSVAQDNYNILNVFFSKYPEFQTNDFYVFGESYAGMK
ncbi:hypothetical protein RFI_19917 [Reticulomyxa filosa]|uniref:Carboxypeptidase n=1 Tax=Reticulomyxa filosa TaxID=46433 RepID=X6MUD1_RETFI|nr:hypothetical protein RFI_19917 [Reticulomyxa filosa]|eukprot:ETO17404.1 hypothetical protein RFI_19917 [Reticulomyxa filosa]